jgi:hypothetical protein
MNVKKISVGDDRICFELDTEISEIKIKAFSPAIREHIELGTYDTKTEGCRAYIPRNVFGRDGLYLAYELYHNDEKLSGISYADEFDMTPENDYPYPPADTKKGLQINADMIDDAIAIGAKHCAYNVCIGDLMRSGPESCIVFHHDGRDYYFDSDAVAAYDRSIRQMSDVGIIVTLILLCTQKWPVIPPEEMYDVLLHPDYINEREKEGGFLSGFNVMTDEGIRHYAAFIAFLTHRYTDPSQEHGRAVGMIISNEVNSHWVWNNCGHKNVEEVAREYTTALRVACQASVEVYKNMRIYVSLDHFWVGAFNTNEKDKYTGSRYLLENLAKNVNVDGDFHWNVAFHPYPEDLNFPDFWNDKTATDDNDTYRITFKNLGVLSDFLYREENLYKGERRRIILSEQGFSSNWTPESEILQACAYGRAYRAVMEIPEIDSFIYHAHGDNAGEGGSLNLGLWRRNKDKPGFDAPKPIYYVFKAIDHRDESGRYHWERY